MSSTDELAPPAASADPPGRPSSSCASRTSRSVRGRAPLLRRRLRGRRRRSRPFGRIRVHVACYGPRDAPPLLLVHGLMTSSYSWRYLFEQLGDRYRLVAPDLPGAGRSRARRPAARTAAASARDVHRRAPARRSASRGCLAAGNSLGGYLCMRRALDDPRSFARLAVIHTPGACPSRGSSALHVALRVPGVARVAARASSPRPAALGAPQRPLLRRDAEVARGGARVRRAAGDPRGARSFARDLGESLDPRELARSRASSNAGATRATGFPVPLALIYAREDPTVPPQIGRKLHALVPEAEFHWLDRSSHFAQVDSPEHLAALLDGFLELTGRVRAARRRWLEFAAATTACLSICPASHEDRPTSAIPRLEVEVRRVPRMIGASRRSQLQRDFDSTPTARRAARRGPSCTRRADRLAALGAEASATQAGPRAREARAGRRRRLRGSCPYVEAAPPPGIRRACRLVEDHAARQGS